MMMQFPEVQPEQQQSDFRRAMINAFWAGMASAAGAALFNALIKPEPRHRRR
jgi:hypothetical protein